MVKRVSRAGMAVLVMAVSLWAAGAAAATSPATPVIMVFGDSLSAEYGLPRGAGWAALLDHRLKEKRFNYSVVNASISGETTSGGAARIGAALQQHKPAVVILELGGNDGLRGLALDATRANLKRMIEASTKAGARVVLVGMQLPPNYGRSYTEGFRTLYGELAKQYKAALVPFFFEGVADHRELFQSDGIHPTREAQPRLLDNAWKALVPVLARAGSGR